MVEYNGDHSSEHLNSHPIHWYIVCAIVGGCFALLVGLSACAYQCYKRRYDARQDPNVRLSTAIRKGLMKEYRSGSTADQTSITKSPSLRSTGSTQSGGGCLGHQTQHDTPSNLFRGGWGGGSQPSGSAGIEMMESKKAQCSMTSELKRSSPTSPQEKGQSSTEKAAENDSKISAVLGTLHFTIQYDHDKAALVVAITKAKDLPVKDLNIGSSDPYVKLQLLPDKRQKVKTRVLRKTLNPVFDEIFTFYGIDDNQLSGMTLHFVVLSYDRFSRDDIIGEVIHPLSDSELGKIPVTVCKEIQPRYVRVAGEGRGELLVSVCHHPAANRLTVVILKARNLPKMDITGLSDPYVKIYLRCNGQRISKKKTHVKKRTLNPVFNESFIFDLPVNPEGSNGANCLNNISLELYILDWDQMTKNEIIGRLEIGKLNSPAGSGRYNEQETRHWNEVMNCPRKQIAGWHKLRE